jgi:Zn-dependent protease with chaperone function/Flp pilus assembly protein TadD
VRAGRFVQLLGAGLTLVVGVVHRRSAEASPADFGLLASGATLIAVPFALRWGGGFVGALRESCAAIAIVLLPVLPSAFIPVISSHAWAGSAFVGVFLMLMLRDAGMYLHTARKLPEAQGPVREGILRILEKAGLNPKAVLEAPFPSYNAGVLGLRDCLVIVDRRAAREMPPEELAAIAAHEAGHAIRRDPLLLLALPGLSLFVAALATRERPDAYLPLSLCLFLGGYPQLSRALEFRADRFGAGLAGAAALASALRRIHADTPLAFRRVLEAPWTAAGTHPPMPLRIARLLGEATPRFSSLGILRGCLTLLPLALAAFRPDLPWPAILASGLTILAWTLLAWFRIRWIYLRSYRTSAPGRSRVRPTRWVLIVWILLLCLLTLLLRGGPYYTRAVLITSLAALLSYVTLRITQRPLAAPLEFLPRPLRTAVVETSVALLEGRLEDALRCTEALSPSHREHPWGRYSRGSALFLAGRADEARTEFAAAAQADPRFLQPRINLSILDLVSGRPEASLSAADEAAALAPEDPVVWLLRGQALTDAGRREDARAAFDRALALKPGEPTALAEKALIEMDENRPAEEAVRAALEAGPRKASSLLARARWLHVQGRSADSAAALQESLAALAPPELRPYRAWYEARARRWGLFTCSPPGTPGDPPGPAA